MALPPPVSPPARDDNGLAWTMHFIASSGMMTPRWLALALLTGGAVFAQSRPMELDDLFRLHRVSDPQVSPDGRHIAYVVTDVLKAENRTNADIWLINADGTAPKPMTNSPKPDRHPRWSPDGKWIAFESMRSGEAQVFL